MSAWFLLTITCTGVFFAYRLRAFFSGEQLTFIKFFFCLCFNLLFFLLHSAIIQHQCFMFYWCYPTLHDDFPAIGWISFLCLFLHVFASPVGWTPRKWFG